MGPYSYIRLPGEEPLQPGEHPPRSNTPALIWYGLHRFWPFWLALVAAMFKGALSPHGMGAAFNVFFYILWFPLYVSLLKREAKYVPRVYAQDEELTSRAREIAERLCVKAVPVHRNSDKDGLQKPFILRRGGHILVSDNLVRSFDHEMLDYALGRELLDDEKWHLPLAFAGGVYVYTLTLFAIKESMNGILLTGLVTMVAMLVLAILYWRQVIVRDRKAALAVSNSSIALSALIAICHTRLDQGFLGRKFLAWRIRKFEQAVAPEFQVP